MILTIDPGSSKGGGGTGYALFSGDRLLPEKTGIIVSSKATWEERTSEICDKMVTVVNTDLQITGFNRMKVTVYIELPAFFQSDKGMMCATGKRNKEADNDLRDSDLVKLACLVGMFRVLFITLGFKGVELIRVNEWKGNLKKPIVAQRIVRRLEEEPRYPGLPNGLNVRGSDKEPTICTSGGLVVFNSHAIDAIGMGFFVKGVFKANAGTDKGTIRRVRPKSAWLSRKSD